MHLSLCGYPVITLGLHNIPGQNQYLHSPAGGLLLAYTYAQACLPPSHEEKALMSADSAYLTNRAPSQPPSPLEALENRLQFEMLISGLSARFINLPATEVDGQIEDGLRQVVEFLNVDRSSLWQFSEDGTRLHLLNLFAMPGLPPTPAIPLSEQLAWYTETLRGGDTIMLSRLSEDLPEEAIAEREYFSRTGVKSLLAIPVRVGESVTCAMACSTLRAERSWGSDIVARLRLLGEIFANALFRRRADERAHQAYEEIRQLKDRLQVEVTYFRRAAEPPNTFEKIVGQSDELKYVLFRTEQVAPNNTTVLILGETGTGKALIAAAIHNLSPRKARPLITVNCAALPASLIDSELFGHEKGAFTGAETRVMGRFEIADQSSLFLDEIGELPLELQAKLLRVLQTSEFERLGSAQTLKVDVRIIAASNRNLEEEVRRGRFRQDLYYRLNVFPITVPPLRQRPEDIPLLVDVFVQRLARKLGKPITSITKKTLQTLQGYAWPGNVRELESVVERAVIVSSGPTLHLADRLLAPEITVSPSRGRRLDEVERAHIVRILEETRWRISGPNGAAALLGLNPSTLRSRIHKLGIQRAASAR